MSWWGYRLERMSVTLLECESHQDLMEIWLVLLLELTMAHLSVMVKAHLLE